MTAALPPPPNWAGISLEEKYRWFNQGAPGENVTHPAVTAIVAGVAPSLAKSSTYLREALQPAGVAWQGAAADATAAAFQRTAAWASAGSGRAGGGGSRLDGYGRSWTATKNQIAAPQPVGPASWWDKVVSVFGVTSDHDDAVAANAAADQVANDVLVKHYGASSGAVGGFQDSQPIAPISSGGEPGGSVGRPGGGQGGTERRQGGGAGTGLGGPAGGGLDSPAASGSAGGGWAGGRSAGGRSAGSGLGGPTGGGSAGRSVGSATDGGRGGPPHTGPAGWTPPEPAGSSPGSRSAPAAGVGSGSGPDAGAGAGLGGGYGSGLPHPTAPATYVPFAPPTPPGQAGHRPGSRPGLARPAPPPAERAGPPAAEGPPRGTITAALAGEPTTRPGPGGLGPMMGGAPGAPGQERTHRNQIYLPSDEPFRPDLGELADPVITVAAPPERPG